MAKRVEQASLSGRFQHVERACGFEIFIMGDALQSMAVLPIVSDCQSNVSSRQNIVWSSPSM